MITELQRSGWSSDHPLRRVPDRLALVGRVDFHARMHIDRIATIPEPTGALIHDRSYTVRAYREGPATLRIRGEVHDQKPPGLYIADDPDPMSVHRMVVDLVLAFPSLEIIEVEVVMDVTPHRGCSAIEPDYQKLVGLSIARGFSRQVKNLFGGPQGCTHVGALLQAMAPVAIQSMWSMRALADDGTSVSLNETKDPEEKLAAMAFNINTCHIWDEDGDNVRRIKAGEEMDIPVWAEERLEALGRQPSEWGDFR